VRRRRLVRVHHRVVFGTLEAVQQVGSSALLVKQVSGGRGEYTPVLNCYIIYFPYTLRIRTVGLRGTYPMRAVVCPCPRRTPLSFYPLSLLSWPTSYRIG
jgi:hypothetical protein